MASAATNGGNAVASILSQGRPSMNSQISTVNGVNAQGGSSAGNANIEELLAKTTKDNEQLKNQLQQMIDINSQQQMQLAVAQSGQPASGQALKATTPF